MESLSRINQNGNESENITGYIFTTNNRGETKAVLVSVVRFEGEYITVKAEAGAVIAHDHYGFTDQVTILAGAFHPMYSKLSEKPKPEPRKLTLLDLAIAAAKDQWRVGEVVYIWGTRQYGAYLRNVDSFVDLFVTGCQKGVSVFILDMQKGKWMQTPNLEKHYQDWLRQLKTQEVTA